MNRLTPFTGMRPAPVIPVATLGNDACLVGVTDLARNLKRSTQNIIQGGIPNPLAFLSNPLSP